MSGDLPHPPAGPPPEQPAWQTPPPPPHPAWQPQPAGPPKHPSAVTALVLGIVSVVGVLLCGLGSVVGPFAWWLGQKSMGEIDADPELFTGRSEAHSGKILGIIGTVLFVMAAAFWALTVALIVTAGP